MDIAVRRVSASDAEGLNAAVTSVVHERQYLLTLDAPSLQATRQYIAATIDNNYAHYVAVAQSSIVGWADVIPKQHASLKHVGELGCAVVAEYRGQGIGKGLVQVVVEHAYDTGLTRLELEVFADNQAAIALYRQFGFKHEGTKRNEVYVDGKYRDTCIMAQCRI